MFRYDSTLENEFSDSHDSMQWFSRQNQQGEQHEKGGDSNWLHQQLRLQPLSDQPFDFFDTNASDASGTTDGNSTVSNATMTTSVASLLRPQLQQEDQNMQEDIWTLESKMPPRTKFNTFSWDTSNTQFPSFEQTQLSDRNIGVPFITEAPHSLFDPLIGQLQGSSNTLVIYETELVKSLIQATSGLPSIYFDWDQQQHAFKQRFTNYRILGVSKSAIQPVLEQILLFSTRIKTLEYVAQQCQLHPETYGLTGVAFGCCLQELLMYIQQSMSSVFFSTTHPSSMTVLKLYHSVESLATVVEKLHHLCQIPPLQQQQFTLPKGASLLNLLHCETSKFDLASSGGNSALYRDICLVILSYTSVPYANMMSRWLHFDNNTSDDLNGDPYEEFFIGEKSADHGNDMLQRYQVRPKAELPYFVDKQLALYILRSGISIRLLKLAKPDHPLFDLRDSISLKCMLNSTESEEHAFKLQQICNYIRSYNRTGFVQAHNMQEESSHQTNNQNTMQHDIPTLPPLDTKQSDFCSKLQQVLQDETKHSIPTLDTITHQSYTAPIQTWCPLLNESFMTSFLNQFKLQTHLSLLYRYFLFGNGAFVNGLKAIFFPPSSIKIGLNHNISNCWPPRSFDLNLALRSVLLENAVYEYDDLVTFSIKKTTAHSQWNHPRAVEALNFLQLNYDTTYPLNMVITPAILDKYNRIFAFLLQLLRVATVIKRCYEPLRNMHWYRTSTRDLIFKYRFQMDQFISALQSYIHDTAIEATWSSFMQNVHAMQTQQTPNNNSSKDYVLVIMEPHSFRDYHDHVLDRILFQCFLKQSQTRIFQVIRPIMEDVIFFSSILDDYAGKEIEHEDKLSMKCRRIFEQFQQHTQVFVKVLQLLETKGSGRLTNVLKATRHDVFIDLYARHEAKNGMDVFVKDLLTRLV